MRKCSTAWLTVAALVLMATPVLAQDNLDGPWSTAFGIDGTARAPFPVIFPPGGEWEVAWTLESDPNVLPPTGFNPPATADRKKKAGSSGEYHRPFSFSGTMTYMVPRED